MLFEPLGGQTLRSLAEGIGESILVERGRMYGRDTRLRVQRSGFVNKSDRSV